MRPVGEPVVPSGDPLRRDGCVPVRFTTFGEALVMAISLGTPASVSAGSSSALITVTEVTPSAGPFCRA